MNLIELEIHLEAAQEGCPIRIPFVVCKEMARQLHSIQEVGVIELSNSPWSSSVVMVLKHVSLRFGVDYRELNEVTWKDSFPLPQVDDLLEWK